MTSKIRFGFLSQPQKPRCLYPKPSLSPGDPGDWRFRVEDLWIRKEGSISF